MIYGFFVYGKFFPAEINKTLCEDILYWSCPRVFLLYELVKIDGVPFIASTSASRNDTIIITDENLIDYVEYLI